jgi:transposase
VKRIKPFLPVSHGIPRVADRRVVSGIVFVIRNGLRWRDAPPAYGPHKTRFIRKGHHPLHPAVQKLQDRDRIRQGLVSPAPSH